MTPTPTDRQIRDLLREQNERNGGTWDDCPWCREAQQLYGDTAVSCFQCEADAQRKDQP